MRLCCVWMSGWIFARKARHRSSACKLARRSSRSVPRRALRDVLTLTAADAPAETITLIEGLARGDRFRE